jgi:hypothetical protein
MLRSTLGCSLLLLLSGTAFSAQDDDKKAREEAAKKSVEEFKAATKDLKTPQDKALAILAYGESEIKEGPMVAPLAKYLAPASNDINFVVPVAAVDALGKFRGVAQASQTLIAVIPTYKKNPYMYDKVITAIGKVGHESALPFFMEPLTGKDPNAAVAAVKAIGDFPPTVALDVLFREYDRMEKAKGNASDQVKPVIDKAQPEVLKQIQRISGEKYISMKEFQIWWSKRGEQFKKDAAEKEKTAAKKDPDAPKPTLPPVMIMEFSFKENGGNSTGNSGASGGHYASATITTPKPSWNAAAPPNGGPSSLDWGLSPGTGAVDLMVPGGPEHLKNLKSFTITGWVSCVSDKEGAGDKIAAAGNRILTWLQPNKDGVELVLRSDGSLQLGVNQWAEQSTARGNPGQIPVLDDKAKDATAAAAAARENWRFFAVTYDSTVASGHAKFYVGTRQKDAAAAGTPDYGRGPVGAKIGFGITIGNVPAMIRPAAPERGFRGFIDEVRIFGSTVDGSGALALPEIVKVQNRVEVTNN